MGDDLINKLLLIIRNTKIIKHVHLPIWKEHVIIHMIGAKLALVKVVVQVPGLQLCWELDLVIRST
jgi:hypothetical protein